MGRKAKNSLTVTIELPPRLSDGSFLPKDETFRAYAQIQLAVIADEFLADASLRKIREGYERDLLEARKPEVAEYEKREEDKRRQRRQQAAAKQKELLKAALKQTRDAAAKKHSSTSTGKTGHGEEESSAGHPRV